MRDIMESLVWIHTSIVTESIMFFSEHDNYAATDTFFLIKYSMQWNHCSRKWAGPGLNRLGLLWQFWYKLTVWPSGAQSLLSLLNCKMKKCLCNLWAYNLKLWLKNILHVYCDICALRLTVESLVCWKWFVTSTIGKDLV